VPGTTLQSNPFKTASKLWTLNINNGGLQRRSNDLENRQTRVYILLCCPGVRYHLEATAIAYK